MGNTQHLQSRSRKQTTCFCVNAALSAQTIFQSLDRMCLKPATANLKGQETHWKNNTNASSSTHTHFNQCVFVVNNKQQLLSCRLKNSWLSPTYATRHFIELTAAHFAVLFWLMMLAESIYYPHHPLTEHDDVIDACRQAALRVTDSREELSHEWTLVSHKSLIMIEMF